MISPIRAETVTKYAPIFLDSADPRTFLLIGDIDSRTALNFDRAIDEFGSPDLLVLSSDGGIVSQALIMARGVHSRRINTLIYDGSGCYSACSFVFFAGMVRIADGELGVHQISSESGDLVSGQVAISDILDVLGDFNVPSDLIVDMLRTPPDQMHVLSLDEKVQYGFYLRKKDDRDISALPSEEETAVDAYVKYNEIWSRQNSDALSGIRRMYSDRVEFYGNSKNIDEIMEEKRAFADRWPIREYTVDGNSLNASCADGYCTVFGNVTWDARSPSRNAVSKGLAYSVVKFRMSNGVPEIVSEDGHVIERY